MKKYLTWIPDAGEDEDCGTLVLARHATCAAEDRARSADDDFDLVDSGEVERVHVKDRESGVVRVFDVTANASIDYYASEVRE